jgi:hypothetical protein
MLNRISSTRSLCLDPPPILVLQRPDWPPDIETLAVLSSLLIAVVIVQTLTLVTLDAPQ